MFYLRLASKYSRLNGKLRCRNYKANLPIPKNQFQNLLFSALFGGDFWLGISDNMNEGRWMGDDNTASSLTFLNFRAGEPNGGRDENGLIMNKGGQWEDWPESEKGSGFKV